jgi:hypothetical protein
MMVAQWTLSNNMVLLGLTVLAFIMGCAVLAFLSYHLYLLSEGHTTNGKRSICIFCIFLVHVPFATLFLVCFNIFSLSSASLLTFFLIPRQSRSSGLLWPPSTDT